MELLIQCTIQIQHNYGNWDHAIEPKDKLEKEITEEKSKQNSVNKVELVLDDTKEIYEKEENEQKTEILEEEKKGQNSDKTNEEGKKTEKEKTLGMKTH